MYRKSLILAFLLMAAVNAQAEITNVALGKDVTLTGPFFTGGWGAASVAPETLVDGIFMPQSTQWDTGSVWWDTRIQSDADPEPTIEINLKGTFSIQSFVVQADDNDAYKLFYRDLETGEWKSAWNIPNYDVYDGTDFWGQQTRPNPYDNSQRAVLTEPIETDAFLLKGDYSSSDYGLSVSEIQAFGEPLRKVLVDIKPGSCPNTFKSQVEGVLPVAIIGTADFDVNTIDPASVTLLGVPRQKGSTTSVTDVTRSAVACSTSGFDGIQDLMLKFDAQALVTAAAKSLGRPLINGELLTLPLVGMLKDGTRITGKDVVKVVVQ